MAASRMRYLGHPRRRDRGRPRRVRLDPADLRRPDGQEPTIMIDLFLDRYVYLFVLVLLCIGLYGMLAKGDLVKKVIGMTIFQTAIYIFFIQGSLQQGGTAPIIDPDRPRPGRLRRPAAPPADPDRHRGRRRGARRRPVAARAHPPAHDSFDERRRRAPRRAPEPSRPGWTATTRSDRRTARSRRRPGPRRGRSRRGAVR
jgi:hypothetical protein